MNKIQKEKKLSSLAISIIGALSWTGSALAQPIPVPSGRPIQINEVLSVGESFGGFLVVAGGILAVVVIIATGIMYLTAGSNQQRITSAKAMFKAGIIGALVIFSAGTIISAVKNFADDPLFFFGGGSGTGSTQGYGCNANLQCAPMAGGSYSVPDCYNTCPSGIAP